MPNEEPNEYVVRILGAANVESDEGLERGKDVSLLVRGNVLKVEEADNQDGTYDRVYKIKIITATVQQT